MSGISFLYDLISEKFLFSFFLLRCNNLKETKEINFVEEI